MENSFFHLFFYKSEKSSCFFKHQLFSHFTAANGGGGVVESFGEQSFWTSQLDIVKNDFLDTGDLFKKCSCADLKTLQIFCDSKIQHIQ